MSFEKPEDLATLAQARETYAALLSVHEATIKERAQEMESLEKANQEIGALKEDLNAANEMLDEANTNIGSLTGELIQSKENGNQVGVELKSASERVQFLEQKVSKLETEAKNAEIKAAEICASVGVEPVQVTPVGEVQSQSLLEQMREIKNPGEQMAFFRKHREEIIKGG